MGVVREHTATVTTVVPQLVRCASCGCEFVYEMKLTGTGSATADVLFGDEEGARETANEKAQKRLEEQLGKQELCEAVPCPACYHYQPYMFTIVAERVYDTISCFASLPLILGLLTAVGAAAAWFIFPDERSIILWVGLGGAAAFILGYGPVAWVNRVAARYDPNADALNERRRIAEDRAMPLSRFDELQTQRARAAYATRTGFQPDEADEPWQKGSPGQRRIRGSARPVARPVQKGRPLVTWWVQPSILQNGGVVSFRITAADAVTVVVPPNSEPGVVLALHEAPEHIEPFTVRVSLMRVHPDDHFVK